MNTINRYRAENGSDTPDYVLAEFLLGCLTVFDAAVNQREHWYGRTSRTCPGPFMPGPGRSDLYGELACEAHGIGCLAPEVVDSLDRGEE